MPDWDDEFTKVIGAVQNSIEILKSISGRVCSGVNVDDVNCKKIEGSIAELQRIEDRFVSLREPKQAAIQTQLEEAQTALGAITRTPNAANAVSLIRESEELRTEISGLCYLSVKLRGSFHALCMGLIDVDDDMWKYCTSAQYDRYLGLRIDLNTTNDTLRLNLLLGLTVALSAQMTEISRATQEIEKSVNDLKTLKKGVDSLVIVIKVLLKALQLAVMFV